MSMQMVTFCQVTKKVSQYLLVILCLVAVGCKKEQDVALESKGSMLDTVLPDSEESNEDEYDEKNDKENVSRDPVFLSNDDERAERGVNTVSKKRIGRRRARKANANTSAEVTASNNATATMITSTTAQTSRKSNVAGLSMILDLGLSSNLKQDVSAEADRSSTIDVTIKKGISRHASMAILAGVEQSFVDEKKTSLNNTVIQINRNKIPLTNSLGLKTGISATLPTNQDDREKATLRAGTGASLGLEQKTSLFYKPTTINYGLGALKNYHEYTRNSDLGANLSHRIRYSVAAIVETTKNTTFTMSGYYQVGWTYDDALRTTFNLRESIGYMLSTNTEISISHVNSAGALGANGVDSNVALYDENNSYIELGLSATY